MLIDQSALWEISTFFNPFCGFVVLCVTIVERSFRCVPPTKFLHANLPLSSMEDWRYSPKR